jgi:DNA-binding beta-propeller fold protein YncE
MRTNKLILSVVAAVAMLMAARPEAAPAEQRLLYVASPGIRNYVEHGGIGVLVFDIDHGYKFVKRIPTWKPPADAPDKPPENVKGIAASAKTGRLYVTNLSRVICIDLLTDKILWDNAFEGGCDRLAISPDGALLYVPSLEGPHWNVVDAATGSVITKIITNSGSHNTISGQDGSKVYLAGLKSTELSIADTGTKSVIRKVGPFSNVIRPFTINADESLCFVNVNDLLGFEVGDMKTGKMLQRVEVAGVQKGPVKRHGCPSHGIGVTPDGKELWVVDGANTAVHIFDARQMPPKQLASIKLRDQPGWITFSIDGRFGYPSTGEVIDVQSRKIITALEDEAGRQVQSEKLLEIDFAGSKPLRAGDQFGFGVKRK